MATTTVSKNHSQALARQAPYTITASSRLFPEDAAVGLDYRVRVLGIEWMSFQLRIVNCLTGRAQEMGIDWWVNNPMFRKVKTITGRVVG